MDHVRLLNEVRAEATLRAAFDYAIYDRTHGDHFFDYFEIEYGRANRDRILAEIRDEVSRPEEYTPRQACAYYPPKSSLCYRRMVYLPLKDLVVRYAFCVVFAEYLDPQLAETCFANRRATADGRSVSFTEDFASESWPRFCQWQREQATEARVLLRTDISSFYDSVSHDYLIGVLSSELGVAADCQLLRLFRKLLQTPVVSYSYLEQRVGHEELTRQGLLIGNGTEGFLANLYLKAVDEKMARTDVRYGRYNDDMRIFAGSRHEAERAVLILQQTLLTKGLNLNASKTYIAESPEQIAKLQSKDSDVYAYIPDGDSGVLADETHGETALAEHIDRDFPDFARSFAPGDELCKDSDAKDFCKFLGQGVGHSSRAEAHAARKPWHMDMLSKILTTWQGSARHASWLLVESATNSDVPEQTRAGACESMLELLANEAVVYYAKYRILHHLVRPRKTGVGEPFRLLDRLDQTARVRLHDLALECLREPAFELILTALYCLCALGEGPKQVAETARKKMPRPYPSAIAEALAALTGNVKTDGPAVWDIAEPDETVAEY